LVPACCKPSALAELRTVLHTVDRHIEGYLTPEPGSARSRENLTQTNDMTDDLAYN
jgi:hypothetical protein